MAAMRISRIARAIERAARASLAVVSVVPSTAACSARISPDASATDGGAADVCPLPSYGLVRSDAGDAPCRLAAYVCGIPLPAGCIETYDLAGPGTACVAPEGSLLAGTCSVCPDWFGGAKECTVFDDTNGGHITCNYGPCATGRRPTGLRTPAAHAPTAVASYLARAAYLEAASVVAFERLTRELEAHRAPTRLCEASRRAARDERRHARTMRGLARDAGARPAPIRLGRCVPRSLLAIAIDNSVEGCVRETFGAAVAVVQARRAKDARVRHAMRSIASDETSHAELSWSLARWLDRRLSADERDALRAATARAVARLSGEIACSLEDPAAALLGLPAGRQTSAIFRHLEHCLWHAIA
jgi:hypothetical protein